MILYINLENFEVRACALLKPLGYAVRDEIFSYVARQGGKVSEDSISIRPAEEHELGWVSELMNDALEPYYGGDHRAHAKRIFQAHIEGGHDRVGFFSFEQRMFVIDVNGERAGLMHLVGKRQSTYKISPLIIEPAFRSRLGLGSAFLSYAEDYATAQGARQLYCTVAEPNKGALQFFLRKGFVRAGSSDSHYKNGVTETMLYKPLMNSGAIEIFDEPHVSVLPLEEHHKEQVAALLLKRLPSSFEGVDEAWVQALFAGYARREAADVNAKYKLVFVATDQNGDIIGVAGATPKKGSPIKIMPLIATNNIAFEALLIDLPHQLMSYGHKLYIHINPTVEEASSLQRLGWRLDAAMPGAYQPDIITQQWSLDVREDTMRNLRVKKRFFDLIKSGRKPLEVRVGYDSIKRIQVGERIQLVTHTLAHEVTVVAVRHYTNFEAMLQTEPFQQIAPDCASSSEVLQLLRDIYGPGKEGLGVIVLEFRSNQ